MPFLAIFAIILGILRQLEIFHRTPGVEMFIAFSMAFMTLPSKIFITIVSVTLGIAGVLSSLGFILLFILGSLLYSAGGLFFKPLGFLQQQKALSKIYGGYHKGAESLEKELKMIRVQIAKVQADMLREKPGANLTPYIRKIEALRKQEEDIIKKLEALKFSLKI
ncbi:MAG: hypothetical protein QW412_00870 [Candidatus Aenigmatarchaeota archaeon]